MLSFHQILSWILLIFSLWFVVSGTIRLKKKGKQKNIRNEEHLYAIEKTSELVTTGIYKYIRHPLYSSLLFLAWGAYLKNPDLLLLSVTLFASLFLFFTARADEHECINFFGNAYRQYMKKTKRFVPYLF